jgi:hypothetical protein
LTPTNPECIIAGEARNSLKLGNAYVREKQETPKNLVIHLQALSENPISSLMLPAERQGKTVNPTLKGYRSSRRVEE